MSYRPETSSDRYVSLLRGQSPRRPLGVGPFSVYAILSAAEAPLLLRKGQLLSTLRPALLHPSPAPKVSAGLLPMPGRSGRPAAPLPGSALPTSLYLGRLCALLGPVLPAEASAVLRHDRVVCAAHQRCSAVVPFRFGVTVADTRAAEGLLRDNEALLSRALTRLRDRVEVGVKLRPLGAALPSGLEGIRLLTPLSGQRMEQRTQDARGPLFSASYLILRADLPRFWAALEALRPQLAGQPLIGTGPFAPYSFCTLTLGPAGAREGQAQLQEGPAEAKAAADEAAAAVIAAQAPLAQALADAQVLSGFPGTEGRAGGRAGQRQGSRRRRAAPEDSAGSVLAAPGVLRRKGRARELEPSAAHGEHTTAVASSADDAPRAERPTVADAPPAVDDAPPTVDDVRPTAARLDE